MKSKKYSNKSREQSIDQLAFRGWVRNQKSVPALIGAARSFILGMIEWLLSQDCSVEASCPVR